MDDDFDLVYLGAKRDVVAIDPRDGHVMWRVRLDEWVGAYLTLFVEGDALLVARSGQLYCLDRFTGQRRWKAAFPKMKHAPMMMASASGLYAQQQMAAQAAQIAQHQAAAAAAAAAG